MADESCGVSFSSVLGDPVENTSMCGSDSKLSFAGIMSVVGMVSSVAM